MSKLWKSIPGRVRAVIVVVLVAACCVAAVFGYRAIDDFLHPKATLTNSVVARQLEKIQDLTTAKETDFGFEEYKEGSIAFLTKKSFTMFYTYEARAGVDLSKAKINVDDNRHVIDITLPAPTIQSVSVDPDSLKFFDETSSVFNPNEVSDTADALKDAKAQSEKKLNKGELLKTANEQAKTVIEKMYAPVAEVDSYTLNVTTTEPEDE